MRSDKKQNDAGVGSRETRSRVANNADASSPCSPMPEKNELVINNNKNKSSDKVKRNRSGSFKSTIKTHENSEPKLETPTGTPTEAATVTSFSSMDRTSEKKRSIGSNTKSSSSTPRRRRDLLSNLYSDLSPKYIGFTTPPSTLADGGVCNGNGGGSDSDGGLQTRSTRRRKLVVYGISPDMSGIGGGGSDSEALSDNSAATTLLGSVRRKRGKVVTTPPPNGLTVAARKRFDSPIEKLLVRNGASMGINEVSKQKIVKTLDMLTIRATTSTPNSDTRESEPETKEVAQTLDMLTTRATTSTPNSDVRESESETKEVPQNGVEDSSRTTPNSDVRVSEFETKKVTQTLDILTASTPNSDVRVSESETMEVGQTLVKITNIATTSTPNCDVRESESETKEVTHSLDKLTNGATTSTPNCDVRESEFETKEVAQTLDQLTTRATASTPNSDVRVSESETKEVAQTLDLLTTRATTSTPNSDVRESESETKEVPQNGVEDSSRTNVAKFENTSNVPAAIEEEQINLAADIDNKEKFVEEQLETIPHITIEIKKEQISVEMEDDKEQQQQKGEETCEELKANILKQPEKEIGSKLPHGGSIATIDLLTDLKTEQDIFDEFHSESIESIDGNISANIHPEGIENGDALMLNNAVGVGANKSPSVASLDSAKGSSIVTSTAAATNSWMSFTTGDIFWGQIYTYCYWPCIVCPDPDGETITTEQNARSGEELVLVHVRFFADSGRRNWVKRENLIPYIDLENYKQQMREIRKKYGKKSNRYKLLLPKQSKVSIWREAIKEANKVSELLHEERLGKFFEMYEHKKVLQKLQRKQRKLSIDRNPFNNNTSSWRNSNSMENLLVKNPLAAVKRDRSASPYSPAFSPVKSLLTIKRRKLSDDDEQATTTMQNSQAIESAYGGSDMMAMACRAGAAGDGEAVGETVDVSNENTNRTQNKTMDAEEANSSNSFTALHETELKTNEEYRKFYTAMREFVLEDNNDDTLERSLTVAVRNIWALKQINRQQMQRRSLMLSQTSGELEMLGSTLVGGSAAGEGGEGAVKRLSNRLKILKYRHSLPARFTETTAANRNNAAQQQKQQEKGGAPRSSDGSGGGKPKRLLNRPIEEVIDDIFDLDNKYLFRGMARDPVCKYCLHPGGALYRCSKGCQAWMHEECIGKTPEELKKQQKQLHTRRKSSTGSSSLSSGNGNANNMALIDVDKQQTCASTSLAITPYRHVTADVVELDDDNATTTIGAVEKCATAYTSDSATIAQPVVLTCDTCAKGKPPVCLVCDKENTAEQLVVCSMSNCAKTFHPQCCRYWPQAKFTKSKNRIETFRCPSHVCHTCVSDDPKGKFQHLSNAKLTKCVKCPASYHMDSTCIPAGSQILTAAHIICPRHSTTSKSDAHVNVSWCFICVGGGQVVCCETCPTAVHAKCLNIAIDPHEAYICEECESGRLPLYGEMVWAKFTSFRWWPAIILPPTEIPQNIRRKAHNSNEFVVRFFGTHDHGWISRRRVYLYLEGDSSEPPKHKSSSLDHSYNKGVEEAKRIYEIIKAKKMSQRLSNENKEKLHPQPYVRLKANRAVYPVKLHVDLEKVNKCECKRSDEEPCGPNSNCLNRVLYHECNPKMCPAGERCLNQMFESRLSPRMDVVYLKERGFGLICREPILAGEFVIEYVGEIIDDNEFKQRVAQKSLDRDENFYFLSVEKDYIIDAGPKGNLARFMNHSCDPNCETQKWSVNGLNRIGLFAIKDIPADTELTFNYHWDDLLGNEKKLCLCGAAKCAGEIGGKAKDDRVTKLQENLSTIDATNSKQKTGTIRKRKPLKRLQNRAGEDGNSSGSASRKKVDGKKRIVKLAEKATSKANISNKTIEAAKITGIEVNGAKPITAATADGDQAAAVIGWKILT